MNEVAKICELQHRIDEYERFCEHLFFMLSDYDVNRRCMAFSSSDMPLCEYIIKETKKLIEQCSTSEK